VLANVDYKLGSGISLSAGASYVKKTYQNSVIEAPDRFRRRLGDDISRVYAGVRYTSRRLFTLRGEVAYQKRKSNPDDFSFSAFSATIGLGVKFGR
jgi:hypothetical protein